MNRLHLRSELFSQASEGAALLAAAVNVLRELTTERPAVNSSLASGEVELSVEVGSVDAPAIEVFAQRLHTLAQSSQATFDLCIEPDHATLIRLARNAQPILGETYVYRVGAQSDARFKQFLLLLLGSP